LDLSAADGTTILAAADGKVAYSGPSSGYGNLILIEHTVGGQKIATGYAHMWDGHLYVQTGDTVTAGQHIADVGSSGYSTGAHLHFEIRPEGAYEPAADPEPWLTEHGAADLTGPGATSSGCTTGAPAPAPEPEASTATATAAIRPETYHEERPA
jgi:murein DD-endopeptidase MepM/ murein hydrolase activator NlpD